MRRGGRTSSRFLPVRLWGRCGVGGCVTGLFLIIMLLISGTSRTLWAFHLQLLCSIDDFVVTNRVKANFSVADVAS